MESLKGDTVTYPFIIYTKEIPQAGNNCMDILFADDVTQVIQNWRNNRSELAEDTARETKRISDYEKRWKIKTNINRFNILSISKLKPDPIIVEGRKILQMNQKYCG